MVNYTMKFILFILLLLLPPAVCAQSQTLTDVQLRDLTRQSLDRQKDLTEKLQAAQEFIDSLKNSADKDQRLIEALQQVVELLKQARIAEQAKSAAWEKALNTSQTETKAENKLRVKAEGEVEHQKRKVHFWKRVAEVTGTAAVVAIGIVVLSH